MHVDPPERNIRKLLHVLGDKVTPDTEAHLVLAYNSLGDSIEKTPVLTSGAYRQASATTLEMANIGVSASIVIASLLYYPSVTNNLTTHQIEQTFGSGVARVIEVITAILRVAEGYLPWNTSVSRTHARSGTEKAHWEKNTQENKPKLLLSLCGDPEIAIWKIVDRLFLLEFGSEMGLSDEERQMLATESLSVHAVVADMLGVWTVKSRIEDAALKILDRTTYDKIARDLEERLEERQKRIARAKRQLQDTFDSYGLVADISGRPKHIYSILLKLQSTGLSIHDVNDIQGLRIIVEDGKNETESLANCYIALDIVFELWKPVPNIYGEGKLFRDWVVNPKENGYQSIHTTVRFEGRLLEVQIRTRRMHQWAEYGLAAHWVYKTAGNSPTLQKKYRDLATKIGAFRNLS